MKTLESLNLNGQLPSPKGVALAVLELCRKNDVTTAEIARVVQSDPALSGRLIRLANSVGGGGRSVASVPDAILRVGLAAVRQVVLGFSLVDQNLNGPCRSFDYQRFWSHSLLVALGMYRFGGISRVGAPDELFACGLMAQIGRLGLATIYPAEYSEILESHGSDEGLIELERTRLQTDHAELTAALLLEWGIPKALAEPVFYHETPEASGFSEGSRPYQLVHLLYMAKCLADLGMAPEGDRSGRISELMLLGGKLGLNAEDFGHMVDELVVQWREWGETLRVPATALPAFNEMAKANESNAGRSPATLRVLLVDDDPTALVLIKGLLADMLGHTVYTATNGQEALAVAVEAMPQVVVTDWAMPIMDGLELCRALRSTEWGQTMYVIMLTGMDSEGEILDAFEAGVDDYVSKPISVRALRARLRAAWHYVRLFEAWDRDRSQLKQFAAELAISNRRLERVAMTDLLTDLPNRRAGMNALDQAWNGSDRSGQPLAVILIDIDHFKRVNDSYGHAVGDVVLREVAEAIKVSARRDDSICRLGGEEFLIVCRNADLNSALQAGERLRKLVSGLDIKVGAAEMQVTVSIGVACKEDDTADADALVNGADKALYGAKNAGRNRTCALTQGKLFCGNP